MLELRECLIDRARGAGSAGLGEDSGAHFVRAAEKNLNGKKQAASRTSQPLAFTVVTQTRREGA